MAILPGDERSGSTGVHVAPGVPSGPPQDNLVTWHTIVWALLSSVFSVVLQPVGYPDSTISPTAFAVARSSPIVCLVEITLVLGQILWISRKGRVSFVDAARHIWLDRFRDDPSKAFIDGGMWGLAIAAFCFGTLKPTIQIFACKNIPGSQAIAAIFLIAFLLPEALRVVATMWKNHPLPPVPESLLASWKTPADGRFGLLGGLVLFAAVVAHPIFWIWTIVAGWPFAWFTRNMEPGYQIPLSFWHFFQFVAAIGMAEEAGHRRGIHKIRSVIQSQDVRSLSAGARLLVCVKCKSGVPDALSVSGILAMPLSFFSPGATALMQSVVYCYALGRSLCRFVVMSKQDWTEGAGDLTPEEVLEKADGHFHAVLPFVMNLASILLFYSSIYNPEGTVGPGWE